MDILLQHLHPKQACHLLDLWAQDHKGNVIGSLCDESFLERPVESLFSLTHVTPAQLCYSPFFT